MIMRATFVIAALFAGYAGAQSATSSAEDPSTTSGIPACVLTCSTQAAQMAGCSSFADISCVCTNTEFQTAALECLQANCSTEEQQAALTLQQQLCGASTASTSPAATETTSETGTQATSEAGSEPVSTATATAPTSGSSLITSSRAVTRTPAPTTGAATSSAAASNAAGLPAVLDLVAAGTWTAVALGGAVVAQLAL